MISTSKIKVYLAAKYSQRKDMELVGDYLKDNGYEITSRWVYGGEEGLCDAEIAILDIQDVDKCDILISFTQKRGSLHKGGGRHVEFGYAFAKGKRCILIGPRENVFHYLPFVEVYKDLNEFVEGN